jgi:hypothetical protein
MKTEWSHRVYYDSELKWWRLSPDNLDFHVAVKKSGLRPFNTWWRHLLDLNKSTSYFFLVTEEKELRLAKVVDTKMEKLCDLKEHCRLFGLKPAKE